MADVYVERGGAYGKLNIHPIDTNTVRVDAGIPMNVEPWEPLTIRGVRYAVQALLHRGSDGRFHCGLEGDDYNARVSRANCPNLSRQWTDRQTISASAQDKAREVIEQAVNEWAESHGALALAEAEVHSYEREVERLSAKHYELADQAQEVERDLELAEENLEAARREVENWGKA
jgi:hypothetical protein